MAVARSLATLAFLALFLCPLAVAAAPAGWGVGERPVARRLQASATAAAAVDGESCTPEQANSPELRAAREKVRTWGARRTLPHSLPAQPPTMPVSGATECSAFFSRLVTFAGHRFTLQTITEVWALAAVSVGPYRRNITLQQETLANITTPDATLEVVGAGKQGEAAPCRVHRVGFGPRVDPCGQRDVDPCAECGPRRLLPPRCLPMWSTASACPLQGSSRAKSSCWSTR